MGVSRCDVSVEGAVEAGRKGHALKIVDASDGFTSATMGDDASESLSALMVALEVVSWGIVDLDAYGVEVGLSGAGQEDLPKPPAQDRPQPGSRALRR